MKSDIQELQGVWSIVSLKVEGHPVSTGAFGGSQIVMEGSRFATVSMGAAYGGTFTVDAEATPKTLDLLFTEGPHAGQTSPAIYKTDDDCLTICLGFAGMTRPTDFVTTPGSGHALETLLRETETTAAAPESAAQAAVGTSSGSAAAVRRPAGEWTGGEAAPNPLGEIALDNGGGRADMAYLQGEWAMAAAWMDGQQLEDSIAATAKRQTPCASAIPPAAARAPPNSSAGPTTTAS